MPMHNPPHPSEVIRTEIIEANGLTVTDAAKALGVSRQALSGLLNSKVDLTGDMALRIEKAFGPKMETLMGCSRHMTSFRLANAQARSLFAVTGPRANRWFLPLTAKLRSGTPGPKRRQRGRGHYHDVDCLTAISAAWVVAAQRRAHAGASRQCIRRATRSG